MAVTASGTQSPWEIIWAGGQRCGKGGQDWPAVGLKFRLVVEGAQTGRWMLEEGLQSLNLNFPFHSCGSGFQKIRVHVGQHPAPLVCSCWSWKTGRCRQSPPCFSIPLYTLPQPHPEGPAPRTGACGPSSLSGPWTCGWGRRHFLSLSPSHVCTPSWPQSCPPLLMVRSGQ